MNMDERSYDVALRGYDLPDSKFVEKSLVDLVATGMTEYLPQIQNFDVRERLGRALLLSEIQAEHAVWAQRNFGTRPAHQPLLGAVEEIGELAHAHLKAEQGIRGTEEEHRAAKKDAVADVIIFLMDYCNIEGFDMQELLGDTWDEVKQRDWKSNPGNGVSK
jgi:NTP pyrophosphatase (non-canonical NTP hydrolase)